MPLILAALALSLAMFLASGGGGSGGGITVQSTQGRLVISGLGAFDGYRIFAYGDYWNEEDIMFFAGGASGITGSIHNPTLHGALINANTGTLHLWEVDVENPRLLGFRGNVVPDFYEVFIVAGNISGAQEEAILDYLDGFGPRPDFLRALGSFRAFQP